MAVDLLKKGTNTTLYRETCAMLSAYGLEGNQMDQRWAGQVDDTSARALEKIEADLNVSKANTLKESTRLGFLERASFRYERGDLRGAITDYLHTREYCTTTKHVMEISLNVVRVAIELNNIPTITQHLLKLEQSIADGSKDFTPLLLGKVRASTAIYHLLLGNFEKAASSFLAIPTEMENQYNQIVSGADVAILGGLCSLATMERKDLKSKVFENTQFKEYLELAPEVREILHDFYHLRYTSCINRLEKLKGILQFDYFLQPHLTVLYDKIFLRALKQYVSPFSSVNLNKMAVVFGRTPANLEKLLAGLITSGGIQARIDSHNKVLYAQQENERAAIFEKVLQTGLHDFVAATEANLRLLSMQRNGFMLKHPVSHAHTRGVAAAAAAVGARGDFMGDYAQYE